MKQNEFQTADVFMLNTAIEYSPNAIVSKMVMKKQSGQITLFAFDIGQELSEHTSPFDAVIQIIEGAAEVFIQGKSFNLGIRESIILPGNIPHGVTARKQLKMLLTMIK